MSSRTPVDLGSLRSDGRRAVRGGPCAFKALALASFWLGATLAPPALAAQARQGIVRVAIVNGTTDGPGEAEAVTLYSLASGMEPVASVDGASQAFTLDGFEIEGQRPYLLQASTAGVNYNKMVRFGAKDEIEATVTVYDTTKEWKDIDITTARFLMRREQDRLRVDKLYVVENKTEPKRTFYSPEGSLRFHVPQGVDNVSVSASFAKGMPVPQSTIPLSQGSGYASQTALKPGTTDIVLSYEDDYSLGTYRLEETTYHPLGELLVLVAPADIDVEAEGWESLGLDPQGRFAAYRKMDVAAGSPIQIGLSGGSEHAADIGSSSSTEGDSSGMRVTTLPDPSRPQKWIIVLLMAAALAYGLLTGILPSEEEPKDKERKKRKRRKR